MGIQPAAMPITTKITISMSVMLADYNNNVGQIFFIPSPGFASIFMLQRNSLVWFLIIKLYRHIENTVLRCE